MPKVKGVYQDKRRSWYFKVSVGRDEATGRWKQITRRGFKSAAAAAEARTAFLRELDAGDTSRTADSAGQGDPPFAQARLSALTVAQLIDDYLSESELLGTLGPKTLYDYRHYADTYVKPHLGDLMCESVTPTVVATWQRHLAQAGAVRTGRGLAANTIRLARAPLRGAFNRAVADGLVTTNPVSAVAVPKKRRSIPAHWSPEQARSFLAWMEGDRLWPLWAFMLSSGLRIGELVWLRWSNVDFDRRLVRINEFATTLGYDLVSSEGKSKDAVRTLELDDHLVRVLRRQRRAQQAEQLVSTSWVDTDTVFAKPNGLPYHPQSLSKLLGRLCGDVGVPRLTAHGLRHTSATLMLASGVAPKVAAERLGHADATLFSNLYSHVTPTMQREAAERIGALLFEEPTSTDLPLVDPEP